MKDCFDTMNENTVIVFIQFRPQREQWDPVFIHKIQQIQDSKNGVSPYVTYIANKKIAFFIITKTEERLKAVKTALENYQSFYPSTLIIENN